MPRFRNDSSAPIRFWVFWAVWAVYFDAIALLYSGSCHDLQFLSQMYYIRMERRGKNIWWKVSPDGIKWTTQFEAEIDKLPQQVRVGAVAEGGRDGGFKAVFDQFKLTSLK